MKEKKLVLKLIEKGYKIATAESCTGGMLAATIVNVPMASKVIDESIVTYANEAKIKYVGVLPETIEKHGVVSEEVACQMAEGVAKTAGSNVGVGISGIAGPSGGTATKPVGMVCFGFSVNGKTQTHTKFFKGSRTSVRKKSTKFAILKLLEILAWVVGFCFEAWNKKRKNNKKRRKI